MKRIQCQRCTTTFRVQKPKYKVSEPCADCGKPFWHGTAGRKDGKAPVIMGVDPENLDLWLSRGAREVKGE